MWSKARITGTYFPTLHSILAGNRLCLVHRKSSTHFNYRILVQHPLLFWTFLYYLDLAKETFKLAAFSARARSCKTDPFTGPGLHPSLRHGKSPSFNSITECFINPAQTARVVLTGSLSLRSPRRGEDREYESAKPRNTKPT